VTRIATPVKSFSVSYAGKVLQRVVRQLLVDVRVADMGRGMNHQRVAVGRRLRHDVGTDGTGRAAAVLDHELLAHGFRELLEHDAADDVVGAARRPWDHDAHRLGRVRLGKDRNRRKHGHAGDQRRDGHSQLHGIPSNCCQVSCMGSPPIAASGQRRQPPLWGESVPRFNP